MLKRYRFGSFRLDPNLRSLRTEGGQSVELKPKEMDVLIFLIQNRDRVVSKEDLLNALWRGIAVNDSNVYVNISNIRKALERHGGQNLIETNATQGYHFTGSVEEWPSEANSTAPRLDTLGAIPARPYRQLA